MRYFLCLVMVLGVSGMGCATAQSELGDDPFYIHEPGKPEVRRVCEKPCLSEFDTDALVMGLGH